MATITVHPNGSPTYDYDNLAAAVAAAVDGDTIQISGTWSSADQISADIAIADKTLTITATGNARATGEPGAGYVLEQTASNQHVFELSPAVGDTLTFDGFEIRQKATGTSYEGFRWTPNGTGATLHLKNMLVYGPRVGGYSQQDMFYTQDTTGPHNVIIENSIIAHWGRSAVGAFNISTVTVNVEINASTFVDIGAYDETRSGIFGVSTSNNPTCEIDCFNSILGVESPSVFDDAGTQTYGSIDVDRCITNLANFADADTVTDSQVSQAFADSGTAANTVLFENVTTWPYDLRIQDGTNSAQDVHVDGSGVGLTMPSTDIAGTSRPQNTNYDIGAFEITTSIGYTESANISSIATITASDSYTGPNYLESANLASTGIITLVDTFNGPNYSESTSISSIPTITTVETYNAPDYNESAIISDIPTITVVESYSAPSYNESAILASSPIITTIETYSGSNYDENAILTNIPTITAVETYNATNYNESTILTSIPTITVTETYNAPDYNENAIVSSSPVITTIETYIAPNYNESAIISSIPVITAIEIWTQFPTWFNSNWWDEYWWKAPWWGIAESSWYESSQISSTASITALEDYTAPGYSESAILSAIPVITAVESFGNNYNESAVLSNTGTINAVESYIAQIYNESSTLTTIGSIITSENWLGPVYAENTILISTPEIVAIESLGNSYFESTILSNIPVINTIETYIGPSYNENTVLSDIPTIIAAETYNSIVYNENTLLTATPIINALENISYTYNENALVTNIPFIDTIETYVGPIYSENGVLISTGTIIADEIYYINAGIPEIIKFDTYIKQSESFGVER